MFIYLDQVVIYKSKTEHHLRRYLTLKKTNIIFIDIYLKNCNNTKYCFHFINHKFNKTEVVACPASRVLFMYERINVRDRKS